MKPNELRINNWYNSTKFNAPVMCEVADFVAIYENAQGATPDETDVAVLFKPIPLTFEWWEKWFKWNLKHCWWTLGDLTFVQWQSPIYIIGIDELDGQRVNMEYVHQLQNLCFALTKKELNHEQYTQKRNQGNRGSLKHQRNEP